MNNNVLEEFFIWEEKNLIDYNVNLMKNEESVKENSITETEIDSTKNDWRDITNPKLKKKMRNKAYREANKDKIKEKSKSYYEVNKNKRNEYRAVNKDKIKKQRQEYYQKNKEKIYEKKLEWICKNKDNIKYKLSCRLRDRLRDAIKNNYKSGSAVKDLGCTIDELKLHLESKFQSGMTWDNYGLYGWHIDHIKPLASFDLTDRNQLLEACHYTNLQPLWAQDNLSKKDKI